MSTKMFVRAQAYNWQCSTCKSCNKCRKTKDNKMLYCMQCDRGFHIYCLGLRNVPEGNKIIDLNSNLCQYSNLFIIFQDNIIVKIVIYVQSVEQEVLKDISIPI